MSTIPSRTRSLRKPADTGIRNGRLPEPGTEGDSSTRRAAVNERSGQSPSRLPTKQTTRATTTAARPPSATGSITTNGSMRPPPSRANISKPTIGGLQRSTSTRRADDAPSTTTDPIKQDRSRPPLTQSRHLRNASATSFSASTRVPTHTRNKSSSTVSSSSTALRPPSRDAGDIPKAHNESQLRRPAFSTLQQHFSPAKSLAPKPHPAAFLAPPSPSKLPSNIAISAETARLQNELLQLHLLHRNATLVDQQWRQDAKRKLGARFQSVVDKNKDLTQVELEEIGKINAAALKRWQDEGRPGWGLDEKIQILDEVATGVWNLGEPGGRYSKLVRKFEKWLRRSQDILGARNRDDDVENDEMMFLEELDTGWKDDCLNLRRRLDGWNEHLRNLGPIEGGSSLAAIVSGCQKLVRTMLAELTAMTQIEKDALATEVEWIKKMNDDVMDDDNDKPVAGAIWRAR